MVHGGDHAERGRLDARAEREGALVDRDLKAAGPEHEVVAYGREEALFVREDEALGGAFIEGRHAGLLGERGIVP